MRNYEYLRAHKRCVRCQGRDERTMSGKCMCEVCAAKARDRTPEERERLRKYTAERRARLRAAGICISCGKKPAEAGRIRCSSCAARHQLYFS